MLHAKLMTGLLAGVLATAAVGTATREIPARETPLGRLVAGNLGRLMTLRAELNLTDQQRAQIREVLMAHRTEIAAQAKNVWEKRQALRNAAMADGSNEAAIRHAADELGKAAGDAAVLASKLHDKVAPILTAEQKAKIRQTRTEISGSVEAFLDKASKGVLE
jgi:Spy/CpxP family protein refolding chaperone